MKRNPHRDTEKDSPWGPLGKPGEGLELPFWVGDYPYPPPEAESPEAESPLARSWREQAERIARHPRRRGRY